MIIYKNRVPSCFGKSNCVGITGENLAYTQEFLISDMPDIDISYSIHLRFSDGSVNSIIPDSVQVSANGTKISWIVKKTDIFMHGFFELQIEGRNSDGLIYQTEIVSLYADESLAIEDREYENPNSETLRLRDEAYSLLTQISEHRTQIEENYTDLYTQLGNKENSQNKINSHTEITDSNNNYPSIYYLNQNFYNVNESYNRDAVDTMLSEKANADEVLADTDGSVKTSNIASKAVTSDKLANGSVTSIKIANGAVSSANIADNQVTTDKLTSGAVTTAKLDNGAVTTDKIADKAITSDKLADNVLSNYDTSSQVDTKLSAKVGTSDVVSGFAKNTTDKTKIPNIKAVEGYLNDYYYDASDIDSMLDEIGSGADGKSAYELAVEGGYTGTQAQWLESLRGADGVNGTNGTNGTNGLNADELIPEYIHQMADSGASKILSAQCEDKNAFTILCMSDFHNSSLTGLDQPVKDAADCAELLTDLVSCDLVCLMGDYINGGEGESGVLTTSKAILGRVTSKMSKALRGKPSVWLKGNHDNNYSSTYGFFNDATVHSYVSHRSTVDTVTDNPSKSYGYVDYPNSKIRVIFLNTSDNSDTESPKWSQCLSYSQLDWFANDALDLSDKDDVSQWRIIIVSHVPFWSSTLMGVRTPLRVINDYYNGNSRTINPDGSIITTGSVSYDFANKNEASIICCLSGHVHGIYDTTAADAADPTSAEVNAIGSGSFDAPIRLISIPNVSASGSNYSNLGITDIAKTSGTATSTAMTAITIQPNNQKIKAIAIGAGQDREFNLDNTIPEVPTVTNLIPTSLALDGNGVFNGTGYMNGKYVSGASTTDSDDASTFSTGAISFGTNEKDTVFYVKGAVIDSSSHVRVQYLTDSFAFLNTTTISNMFTVTELDTNYYSLTPLLHSSGVLKSANSFGAHAYIRFSFIGDGGDCIITKNEEI